MIYWKDIKQSKIQGVHKVFRQFKKFIDITINVENVWNV